MNEEFQKVIEYAKSVLPKDYELRTETRLATVITIAHKSGVQAQLTSSASTPKELGHSIGQTALQLTGTLVANGIDHQPIPFLEGKE